MFKIRSILFLLLCLSVALAVPPVLNLYIIPFDNSKSDAPLNWLSDAFPEMIKTDLNNYDNVFLKNESDLERIMSNRSLLLQQRPGTKNFLVLGKYERALDKLSVSIQLIDISSWEEVGLKKIRGDYNDVSSTNKSITEMVSTLLKPYLPMPNESIYPALTDGKRMRTPPTYAERAMDVSSSIDAAIEELEKRMDVNMGVRGEENEFESKEIEGEWILNIEEESYENDRPENEFNTTIMVEVLEKLMSNPYEIKLEKPEFNFDPNNKKEFQVALNVNYKLKAQLIKDMLKSLPYSGLKQDGSLTVFYFNKDKYNFPMNITERIQLGKHRTVPVIQLRDRNDNPLVILVDSPEKEIHNLNSKKIIYKPFHSFSPLIDFSVGGWSMQVSLENVEIPVNYTFSLGINNANSISKVSLKFIPENELFEFLSKIL